MKQEERLKLISKYIWLALALVTALLSCFLWATTDMPVWVTPFASAALIFAVLVVLTVIVNAVYELVIAMALFINTLYKKRGK